MIECVCLLHLFGTLFFQVLKTNFLWCKSYASHGEWIPSHRCFLPFVQKNDTSRKSCAYTWYLRDFGDVHWFWFFSIIGYCLAIHFYHSVWYDTYFSWIFGSDFVVPMHQSRDTIHYKKPPAIDIAGCISTCTKKMILPCHYRLHKL